MGLLDKVKGILFDEEEVEIPEIKKEPKRENKREIKKDPVIENIEEINPIKEIKVPKDDFSDKESYKSESTFTFPIDFEDDEPIVEKTKPTYVEKKLDYRKETRDYSDFLSRKEEKKQFKPTPIISPVYGILDQNYKKEDVIVKKDILRKPSELTLEEVRKRAFGTLEDDLNLTNEETKEEKVVKLKAELEKKTETIVEEPVDKMKTIGELIEEDSVKIDIPIVDSINDEEIEYTNNDTTDIDDVPKNSIEDLLSREEETITENFEENDDEIDEDEADLFSLIDSMYEEKGE